jgi:formiminoglutamase
MYTAGHLKILQQEDIDRRIVHRQGEEKTGSDLRLLKNSDPENLFKALKESAASGAKYAVLGISEDVGVRANLGRKGARSAWNAFLTEFLNLQSNPFLDSKKVLLIGEVAVEDLQKAADEAEGDADPVSLFRRFTAELDTRVSPIIESIADAGLEPIVIGGGHNNAYPILKGMEASLLKSGTISDRGIGCINCDAHLDFRPLEGRHSGNSFSYAHHEGILKAYAVIGLQEQYNNAAMLERFRKAGFRFWTYEDFAIRGKQTFETTLTQALEYLRRTGLPIGMEVDLDSMANVPASAEIPFGLSAEQVFRFIHTFAKGLHTPYIHITEGAPNLGRDGERKVGRLIAMAVSTYLKAREKRAYSP